MDISELRTFEAVARLGSMNRAAAELHTVQSNITARMQALEDELGMPLLRRHARGVSLTSAGQRLLPFAGRVMTLLAEAQVAARDDGTPEGALVLGGLETTTALRLSPVLTRFARAYPRVRLAFSAGTTARLVQDVVDGRLDGAFVAGPIDHPELAQETVFAEELALLTSPAIRSLKGLAGLAELRTIVFQSGCSYRQRLEAFLAQSGIVVAKPLELGSLDAILSCVAAGVGVTLLPKGVAQSALAQWDIRAHRLPREQARAETIFVRRRDAYVSSAMAAFLDMSRHAGFRGKSDARSSRR